MITPNSTIKYIIQSIMVVLGMTLLASISELIVYISVNSWDVLVESIQHSTPHFLSSVVTVLGVNIMISACANLIYIITTTNKK